MTKLTLDLDALRVDSFEIARDDDRADRYNWGWSDDSVCPTTAPSERRICP